MAITNSTITIPDERPEAPRRKRWNRREYHDLSDMGFLPGRYELIDGEIIEKMSKKRPHVLALILLAAWLDDIFGRYFVQKQDPVLIPVPDEFSTEPEPDIAVTKASASAYASDSPGADDILFIAEVSDTTLAYDLGYKANLYAAAGISEYWVLDVVGRRMHVLRQPSKSGYCDITVYNENDQVAALARPEVTVKVSALLPDSPTESSPEPSFH